MPACDVCEWPNHFKILLGRILYGLKTQPLFESSRWKFFHPFMITRPGNPVRIRDGCATVTGYELPIATDESREGGSKAKPEVRIPVWSCSSGRPCDHFSVKEKDEASPVELSSPGLVESLIPRFAGVESFV
jgi:hypothetical protein